MSSYLGESGFPDVRPSRFFDGRAVPDFRPACFGDAPPLVFRWAAWLRALEPGFAGVGLAGAVCFPFPPVPTAPFALFPADLEVVFVPPEGELPLPLSDASPSVAVVDTTATVAWSP